MSMLRMLTLLGTLCLALPAQGQLALHGGSPFQNEFYELDPATGAALSTTAITVPGRTITGLLALSQDPTSGIFYGVVKASGVSGRLLVTLDLDTAVGVEIGNLGDNFSTLAFRADGQLFGVTGDGATVPETLYLIDKSNASKVVARALGNGADGEVIAYNPNDGLFYHWSGNGTVVFESIGSTPPYTVTNIPITGSPGGETFGATWDAANNRFLVSNISSSLQTVTPAGVFGTAFGSTPDDIRGLVLSVPDGGPVTIACADWTVELGSWDQSDAPFCGNALSSATSAKYESISLAQVLSDFSYEVQLIATRPNQPTAANTIFVRGTPDPLQSPAEWWNTGIAFNFAANGKYSIFRYNGASKPVALQAWTTPVGVTVNGSGLANTLRVEAAGGTLVFSINGVVVRTLNGITPASGQIGVGMVRSIPALPAGINDTLEIVDASYEEGTTMLRGQPSAAQDMANAAANLDRANLDPQFAPQVYSTGTKPPR